MYMNVEFEPVYISRLTGKYYVLPKNKCKFIKSHFHFHFLWQRVSLENECSKIRRWNEAGQHHEREKESKTEGMKEMEIGREIVTRKNIN
jgi:hypothetical protein